jgi:tetratricopeptide (TPR) repeat protein
MKRLLAAAALSTIAPLAPAAAQPVPAATVQQQFDAASAALEAANWEEALRQFEALEARLSNPRSLAIVRVRKAAALVELERFDEATAALRAGLAQLPEGDASLQADRFSALLTSARIAESGLEYAEALRHYRTAAALAATDAERLLVARGLIQTSLFDDVQTALRDADAALALVRTAAPDNRQLEALFHTLKGRALLNMGRFGDGEAELQWAMRLLGNLTLRVDRHDLVARGDLALAALLASNEEAARRYLAFTGAGQFQRGYLGPWFGNRTPRCGEHGLRPDDVAVIEFGVRPDGTVNHVMPIYASRPGESALHFARAVAGWYFQTRGLGDIPPLLLSASRVEIRCTKDEGRDPTGVPDPLRHWVDSVTPAASGFARSIRNPSAASIRGELAALEQRPSASRAREVELLWLLVRHATLPADERLGYLRRALALAAQQRAPPQVIAHMALAIDYLQRQDDRSGAADFQAMLALPEVAADPAVAAWLRLIQAYRHYTEDEDRRAMAIVTELRGRPEIESDARLRTQLLELDTAIQAVRGDLAAARAAHEAIGPDATRCGVVQRRERDNASGRDFPDDAMRWGFEGWATSELTVSPGGNAVDARTVTAYPPFVFSEAGRTVARRSVFADTYVPDGRPCAGALLTVYFRISR